MTKCLPPVAMHDMLEGIIPAVVKIVLRELVRQGFITYEQVGRQMNYFKFGRNDSTCKPVAIAARTLRQYDNMAGSASQKLCLFRLLSFIFGEFLIEETEVWEMYLSCREIVDICLAPVVKKSWLAYLEQEVLHLNEMFSRFSPNTLPCKFHYLLSSADVRIWPSSKFLVHEI